MSEIIGFEPKPEQFGVFWKYLENPDVTDVDYNGSALWITDIKKGRYRAEEEITEPFISSFTHMVSNAVNKPFNDANKILEADTKELRISIIHDSITESGISICIRRSPCQVRNTVQSMIDEHYCSEEVLQLLINCVLAKMNFVFGGEPGSGKTELLKFLMQFIPKSERVITIEDNFEIHYGDINPGADAVGMRVAPSFSYTDAIKASLRQNPMWLVLSEARSLEVASLMEQWSTGLNGFTTVHLDDMRKLQDRILNMMDNVEDADRMENRIYDSVNVGILIRKVQEDGKDIRRYIDQLCFYSREDAKNCVYMIVKNGKTVSRELPVDICEKFKRAHISEPFRCEKFEFYRKGGRE